VKIQPFLIERYYAKYEFNTLFQLSASDSESFTVEEILSFDGEQNKERNTQQMLKFSLNYTESQGSPLLRDEIVKLYPSLNKEQILVFSGAEEGIFTFMNAVLSEGDHIIVQFPCYQSLYAVAQANKVEIDHWKMEEEKGWKPDILKLQSKIKENTRAIIINTPNNPTGYNFTDTEFDELIEICRKNNLILFSDEVYRLSEYSDQTRLQNAAEKYENAISLGVLSKPVGLPGLRIGWIATQNSELLDKLKIFKDYTTICSSGPSEFLATIAIRNVNKLIDRNMKIAQSNLKLLREFLTKYSQLFKWTEPKAGTIGFINILFSDDVEGFCLDLIEKKGVLLLPSTTYNYGTQHFRIGYGRKNFPEALSLLEEYVVENLLL
jgi:aspartate/methionine/tyrosine aminotransferase